ncbi:HTH domain-containing protein [Actinomycetospora sp. OC33-EN08]|uniref:HTH domain-containing protein n=1 Tax=Actinomycetospora aurantiaca TaxID=3129233 RepID=A0ABU8MX24_9PSEU
MSRLSDASRDGHLRLRRVERQQWLVEHLHASRRRRTLRELADELHVSERTLARDVERLRDIGVPLVVTTGRHGGVELDAHTVTPVSLDLAELAVVLSSLAVLGPTAGPSAGSAVRKLVEALRPPDDP